MLAVYGSNSTDRYFKSIHCTAISTLWDDTVGERSRRRGGILRRTSAWPSRASDVIGLLIWHRENARSKTRKNEEIFRRDRWPLIDETPSALVDNASTEADQVFLSSFPCRSRHRGHWRPRNEILFVADITRCEPAVQEHSSQSSACCCCCGCAMTWTQKHDRVSWRKHLSGFMVDGRWDTPLISMVRVADIVAGAGFLAPNLRGYFLEVLGCLYMHSCMPSRFEHRVNQS